MISLLLSSFVVLAGLLISVLGLLVVFALIFAFLLLFLLLSLLLLLVLFLHFLNLLRHRLLLLLRCLVLGIDDGRAEVLVFEMGGTDVEEVLGDQPTLTQE